MKHFILSLFSLFVCCCAAHGQQVSMSSNVVDYAETGSMNIGLAYGLSRHVSVQADVKYNPFDFGQKQRVFALGARYWPWYVYSGWWLAGKAQYQEYGPVKDEISEGDRYGGAFSGGYSRMISKHLNLEFGLGFWGGYEKYTIYECPTCGRIVDSGDKMFFRANDILVGLSYIF